MQRLVIILSFILPIAFWSSLEAYSIKMGLVLIADLLLVLMLGWKAYKGEFRLAMHKSVLFLLLLPVLLVISAFFSGSYDFSFFGNTVEVGTVASFLALGFLALATLSAFSNSINYRSLAKTYLVSTSILLLHFLFVAAMSYGWITPLVGFPLVLAGSYADLSVLLGLGILAAAFLAGSGVASGIQKAALYLYIVLSLLVIGAVGYMGVEIVLGLFFLFGYILRRRFSKASILVFAACLLFVVAGTKISAPLSSALKVSSLDARPSLSSTANIVMSQWKDNFAHNFILGAGPNRFTDLWSLYKPVSVNATPFWSQDFFFGSSMAVTLAATGGAFAIIALLGFALYFFRAGAGAYLSDASDPTLKDTAWRAFSASLYLWLFFFIYNPGVTVLALAFVSLGIFVSSLVPLGLASLWQPSLGSRTKKLVFGFAGALLLVVFVYSFFYSAKKLYAANVYYRALNEYSSNNNLGIAEAGTLKAVALSRSDVYFRTLVSVYSLDIENKVKSLSATTSKEVLDQIQNEINFAEAAAKAAIEVNPLNYANYMTEAGFYEQLAYQKVGGALEKSEASYVEAAKRNPSNPAISLGLARLSVAKGDSVKAKEHAAKSISLKPNYSAAYYLLAQLEAAGNNVEGAIVNVEKAALSEGNNAGLYFQLGLLKYNVKDYKGAKEALENSIVLVPDYANAKYFLGLSYYYSGDKDAAVKQFEEVVMTNPDNAEVKLIIENLKAGRDPFENAKPPVDSKPEKRKTPPVND